MLALKLLLVPAFLALVSLAGRRWGPRVAGWLAGLPVVAGPILGFLALERGAGFASQAAAASLAAVVASVAFSLAYSHACLRVHWAFALPAGLGAWLLAALLLALLPSSVFVSLGLALVTLLLAPRLFPRAAGAAGPRSVAWHELVLRMLAGALLTLTVTAVAATVGASWSGLLTVFPVLGTVLAVFSHRTQGPAFVVTLLRAMATGLYSFVAFCFTLSIGLAPFDLAPAFGAAVLAAAMVQMATARAGGPSSVNRVRSQCCSDSSRSP